MPKDTLFPQVPVTVEAPTQSERDEIAAQLVNLWLDPPEVFSHWELDGKVLNEKEAQDKIAQGLEPQQVMTQTAHFSKSWRIRQAINRAHGEGKITKEQRDKLGAVKHMLWQTDDDLFEDRDQVVAKIERAMAQETPPKDKAALDTQVTAQWIPVSTFTQMYMDAQVGKQGATWEEFKSLKEISVEDPKEIETLL